MRSSAQHSSAVGQRPFDRLLEPHIGRVTALRQVLVLDLLPLRLDRIQLRAVGRQKGEADPARCQVWRRLLDRLAVMDRIVVQHDHAGAGRNASLGHPIDEGQVGGRVIPSLGLAPRLEEEAGTGRIVRRQRADDIDPSSLGRLIGHHQAVSPPPPSVPGRQRRREAALVQEPQVDHATCRLF